MGVAVGVVIVHLEVGQRLTEGFTFLHVTRGVFHGCPGCAKTTGGLDGEVGEGSE